MFEPATAGAIDIVRGVTEALLNCTIAAAIVFPNPPAAMPTSVLAILVLQSYCLSAV